MIILGVLLACGKNANNATSSTDKIVRIGITQLVEHPSLDEIRRGVEDALNNSKYKEKVVFNFQNAQGDFSTAQVIAEQLNRSSDIIVAITTPSAQAAQNKILEKPIFFTGVTDPIAAGLVSRNITGVSDMSPVVAQIDLLMDILPEANKIGVIYNTSEANSVSLIKIFTETAKQNGLEVISRGITNINEIASAMDSLKGKVNVIYTTKDNTVASAYALIIRKADEFSIPVIGAATDSTKLGALASVGTSEYMIGYQTSQMIIKYLGGEDIKNLPIEHVEELEISLNYSKAKRYKIDSKKIEKNGGIIIK